MAELTNKVSLPAIDAATFEKFGIRLIDNPIEADSDKGHLSFGDGLDTGTSVGTVYMDASLIPQSDLHDVHVALANSQKQAQLWGDIIVYRESDGLHMIATQGDDRDLYAAVPEFDAAQAQRVIAKMESTDQARDLTDQLGMIENARKQTVLLARCLDLCFDNAAEMKWESKNGSARPTGQLQLNRADATSDEALDQLQYFFDTDRSGAIDGNEDYGMLGFTPAHAEQAKRLILAYQEQRDRFIELVTNFNAKIATATVSDGG